MGLKHRPVSPVPLRPAILVIEAQHLPASRSDAPAGGDTAFILAALDVLRSLSLLRGLILYTPNPPSSPLDSHIQHSTWESLPVTTLAFGPSAPHPVRAAALTRAIIALGAPGAPRPIVYHHGDALLAAQPSHVPFAVTHHAPFLADVAARFPAVTPAAPAALRGRSGAADNGELAQAERQQERGICALTSRRRAPGFVLQQSPVQRRHLARRGVDARRVWPLAPPICEPAAAGAFGALPPAVEAFFDAAAQRAEPVLVTAVARLDARKNAVLLLHAAARLHLRRGVRVRVLIAGDEPARRERRAALAAQVPAHLRGGVLAVPRLAAAELWALFGAARAHGPGGVFVCPSRYETLGLTPLEAAAAGVATLVPDDPKAVGAAGYFPASARFRVDAEGLAAGVEAVLAAGVGACGDRLEVAVGEQVGRERFRADLVRAWRGMSRELGGRDSPSQTLEA